MMYIQVDKKHMALLKRETYLVFGPILIQTRPKYLVKSQYDRPYDRKIDVVDCLISLLVKPLSIERKRYIL